MKNKQRVSLILTIKSLDLSANIHNNQMILIVKERLRIRARPQLKETRSIRNSQQLTHKTIISWFHKQLLRSRKRPRKIIWILKLRRKLYRQVAWESPPPPIWPVLWCQLPPIKLTTLRITWGRSILVTLITNFRVARPTSMAPLELMELGIT